MTVFNHTLTASAIAVTVVNPWLAVPLGFLSHFVLDMLPHFGGHPDFTPGKRKFRIWLSSDITLSILAYAAVLAIWPELAFVISLTVAAAVVRDAHWYFPHYMDKRPLPRFLRFHKNIQLHEKPHGYVYEGIYALLVISLLSRLA
jgi:hypothetical protein